MNDLNRSTGRCSTLFSSLLLFALSSTASALPFDGSSSASAGYSAKQILRDGYAAGDGLYWIDPDGSGGIPAFEIFADMTTDGGGWTMGLNSRINDTSASTDMTSNTGTPGSGTGHTRDLTELAIASTAQIRHRLVDVSGGVLFDGYYTGTYHGTLATAAAWTVLQGSLSASGLNYHMGRDWSTSTMDVDDWGSNCAAVFGQPWYHGSCWTAIPVQESTSYPTNAPVVNSGSGYRAIGSWSILVRETQTPQLMTTASVPLPGSAVLVALGMALLLRHRTSSRRLKF